MTTHLPKLSTTFPDFLDEFFNQNEPSFFVKPFSEILDIFTSQDPSFRKNYGVKYFEKMSYPKIDVVQNADKVILYAEIPGLKKENIELKLEENPVLDGRVLSDYVKLSICGSKQSRKTEKDDVFLVKELKQSAFTRSVFLVKDSVDVENYEAKFEDGILEISFKLLKVQEKSEDKSKIKLLKIK